MKKHLFLLSAIVLVGAGCLNGASSTENEDPGTLIDRDAILIEAKENGLIMNDEETASMTDSSSDDTGSMESGEVASYLELDKSEWDSAALADVTGGESFGLAHAVYENGVYMMVANMGGLPELGNDYFYEGWIVRRGADMSVISTGPVEYVEDAVVNVYKSTTDLTDHDFYVLTLEPNDGDPAPAEHILEGTFK